MAITNGPNLGIMINGVLGDQHYNQFMNFLRIIDGLLMSHAKSSSTSAQPGSPLNGDLYVLPASPTGASWTGNGNKVARYNTTQPGWEYVTPKEGWTIYAEDTDHLVRYDGSSWKFWQGQGTTANRPAAGSSIIGAMYFDTTLGKPIWSTGAAWVDATGSAV